MDINQTNKKEIKDMIKENTIIRYFEIKRITDKEIIINLLSKYLSGLNKGDFFILKDILIVISKILVI